MSRIEIKVLLFQLIQINKDDLADSFNYYCVYDSIYLSVYLSIYRSIYVPVMFGRLEEGDVELRPLVGGQLLQPPHRLQAQT